MPEGQEIAAALEDMLEDLDPARQEDEGHDWTDAGPFRAWKTDKMHVGVPFVHLGRAVHLVV